MRKEGKVGSNLEGRIFGYEPYIGETPTVSLGICVDEDDCQLQVILYSNHSRSFIFLEKFLLSGETLGIISPMK